MILTTKISGAYTKAEVKQSRPTSTYPMEYNFYRVQATKFKVYTNIKNVFTPKLKLPRATNKQVHTLAIVMCSEVPSYTEWHTYSIKAKIQNMEIQGVNSSNISG